MVNFVLDRSNSVLIPGRTYFVELLSVTDGLTGTETLLRGTGYAEAMFTMMEPSDSDNNNIEDSLEAAFDNFDAEMPIVVVRSLPTVIPMTTLQMLMSYGSVPIAVLQTTTITTSTIVA